MGVWIGGRMRQTFDIDDLLNQFHFFEITKSLTEKICRFLIPEFNLPIKQKKIIKTSNALDPRFCNVIFVYWIRIPLTNLWKTLKFVTFIKRFEFWVNNIGFHGGIESLIRGLRLNWVLWFSITGVHSLCAAGWTNNQLLAVVRGWPRFWSG